LEAVEAIAKQAGDTAADAIRTAGQVASETAADMYRDARERAREGYSQAAKTAQELVRLTWRSARLVRREYPLQALGVLAGVAFIAGITLRILRERSS
jgi:ElaB/YqjD/DUF883 family membrane-anchored ribosome-binding protein